MPRMYLDLTKPQNERGGDRRKSDKEWLAEVDRRHNTGRRFSDKPVINDAPPDELQGDPDEHDDDEACSSCNGSGQGQYDGWTCVSCGGRGVKRDLPPHSWPDAPTTGFL
jgi:hypothetical protein